MNFSTLLLQRLDEIGRSLRDSGQALALLGLGSCGLETARLDDYSDLDFFAIVEPGQKMRFIDNLDWLERIRPLTYRLRNTGDGYKAMFDDGVFCEFAVFEPHELANIPYAPGRLVWQQHGFDHQWVQPRLDRAPAPSSDEEWLVGEALTCLYVGMGRFCRGEKLSASRFIHQYAFDRILDLCQRHDYGVRDPFVFERRLEQRQQSLAEALAQMQQGLERCAESTLAQLAWLERHCLVNAALKSRILALCHQATLSGR